MGVTIHYTLVQDKRHVESMLDFVQKYSGDMLKNQAVPLGIPFITERISKDILRIDIGECESLIFNFKKLEDMDSWSRDDKFFPLRKDRITDDDLCTKGFCKTQYAKSVAEHRFVADIIKLVASRCSMVNVHDEGDYYHSGIIEDASGAIEENGKMIASIGGMLANEFKADQIVKGGNTTIKKIRRNKHEKTD